jgi:Tfp pilus assembly protein PilF
LHHTSMLMQHAAKPRDPIPMTPKSQKQGNPDTSAILVAKGYKLHEAGKIREAEAFYRQSLNKNPNNADTNNVYGLLCIQTNRFEAATKLIRKALITQPDNPQSHYNLAIAFNALEDGDKAEEHFREAISLAPGNFAALNSLAVILRRQGKLADAVDKLKTTLQINPFYAEAHCNLGITFQDMGEENRAGSSFKRAIEISPGMVEAHNGLAEVLIDQGQLEDAMLSVRQALKINPDYSEAHNTLGIVLNKKGKTEDAISSFKSAAELSSTNAEALVNLGVTLEQSGDLQQATESYQRAIKTNPNFSKAWYLLAHLKNHTSSEDEISAALALFQNEKTSAASKADLAFALACAHESRQQYGDSFNYLQQGHQLKKKKLPFNLSKETRYFQSLKDIFNADFFNKHATITKLEQSVVFIVGMPRSGTSLTEQILASHTSAHGAGELSLIANTRKEIAKVTGRSFPQNCKLLDDADMEMLGLSYIRELIEQSPESEVITDTNPMNFLYVGLIAALLPNARIINCVRNPMDNCLSIFKHLLAEAHAYSHDLEDLGAYFNLYRDLMKHWHETLPGRIYDLPYETLVAESEAEIRKLLEFCELPFEENCLQFHETSRVVRTPSASQVRQPLYTDTINLWERYEQQLKPLQAILNREETHGH